MNADNSYLGNGPIPLILLCPSLLKKSASLRSEQNQDKLLSRAPLIQNSGIRERVKGRCQRPRRLPPVCQVSDAGRKIFGTRRRSPPSSRPRVKRESLEPLLGGAKAINCKEGRRASERMLLSFPAPPPMQKSGLVRSATVCLKKGSEWLQAPPKCTCTRITCQTLEPPSRQNL